MSEDSRLELEERIVSMLVAKPEDAHEVINSLDSPKYFENPTLRAIYSAILKAHKEDSTELGISSINSMLEREGELQKSGGLKRLKILYEKGKEALRTSTPRIEAKFLKEQYYKKNVSELLKDSIEAFNFDSGSSFQEAVASLQEKLIEQLSEMNTRETLTSVSNYGSGYLNLIEERKEKTSQSEDGITGVPSLVPTINKISGGYQEGWLITVSARTGVGKSILAVMEAVSAGVSGKTVMFFTLEMTSVEVIDRMMALLSGVSQDKLKKGILTEEELERVAIAQEELSKVNIIIDEKSKPTVEYVRSRCIEQSQKKEGLDIVIIDYLQIMQGPEETQKRLSIGAISKGLKDLAKGLRIPVIALAQLRRRQNVGDEETDDSIPELDEIMESASIAQDSDMVLIIHRKKSKDNSLELTYIKVAKFRSGESEVVIPCFSNLGCSMFKEIEKHPRNKQNSSSHQEDDFDFSEDYAPISGEYNESTDHSYSYDSDTEDYVNPF